MLIDAVQGVQGALRGKVALVTGGGQGIGRETARVLARLGAVVAIAEISAKGEETAQLIEADGGRALFVATDVADPAAVARLHRQVRAALGPAQILVNNAEAFRAAPLVDHTVEEWDRVFAVNLRGAFLMIRAFLPEMLAQREGVIVTMRSADGMPYLSAYLASKVGLRSLAASLAGEVGEESGVCVYCLGPGMVDTPGIRAAVPQLAPLYGMTPEAFIAQSAPGGRLMDAEVAATGLVGTILHAREYHGQDIDSFVGLQQLGLDMEGRPFREPPAVAPAIPENPTPAAGNGHATGTASTAELNRALEGVLRAYAREYDELSMFMRPIVKRMFQQGTGLKLEAWLAQAEAMTRKLERGGDGAALDLAAYQAQLARLGEFLVKQEADAKAYFKEPERLRAALEGLKERQGVVRRLRETLGERTELGETGK
jgi:NAD(P)-dependent dehydrogenase (short-subunit alcohol dehydrogenase family)